MIYPGKDGPWSSLRFEAQREGLEDFERLRRLKKTDPKTAGKIIAKVLRGFGDYTKDPAVYRTGKRMLLEAMGK